MAKKSGARERMHRQKAGNIEGGKKKGRTPRVPTNPRGISLGPVGSLTPAPKTHPPHQEAQGHSIAAKTRKLQVNHRAKRKPKITVSRIYLWGELGDCVMITCHGH